MNNRDEAIKRCNNLEKELAEIKKTLNQPICIMDRVKTFQDVLDISGFQIPSYWSLLPKDELAFAKLKLIVTVLNEGWTPDWINSNQYKYYTYFSMGDSSSVGFASHDCLNRNSYSLVASLLCFKSRDLAVFAGKQFLDIYKDYMTNQ